MVNWLPPARRAALVALLMACTCAGVLVAGATPALAMKTFLLQSSFGSAGSGPGQLESPQGIAIGEASLEKPAEYIYVTDFRNERVDIFNPAGVYEGEFNGSGTYEIEGKLHTGAPAPVEPLVLPSYIAVDNSASPLDPSAGDVYVTDRERGVVDKFSATGEFLAELDEIGGGAKLEQPSGLTVDSAGDVWVVERDIDVVEFSATGAFVKKQALGFEPWGNVAVDTHGELYFECCGGELEKFNPRTGRPVEFVGGPAGPVAIDSTTGDVYLDGGNSIRQFGPFGEPYGYPLKSFPSEGLSESQGVAVNASGLVYATQSQADDVEVFREVEVPAVSTGETSSGVQGTVTLSGYVYPEGQPVTDCHFAYGTEASYGSSVPCAQTPAQIGTGAGPVAVSAEVSGLQAATTYHFRLLAASAEGANSGSDETFAYGPLLVGGESFGDVGSASVTLHASLTPGGRSTTYHFEYGSSTAYGSSTPPVQAGAGLGEVKASAYLSGLQPDTTYHFRLVAENEAAMVDGEDIAFTTLSTGAAGLLALPDGRGYEMVSSPANLNSNVYEPTGLINGNSGYAELSRRPFRAAADGDSVAYIADPPAAGGNGSVGRGGGNQYLATRGAAGGWTSDDIQPPGVNHAVFQNFSADLSTAVLDVSAPSGLTPIAPGGEYNVLYTRSNAAGQLQPLFTETPPHRTAYQFHAEGFVFHSELAFAGASADGSHLLFEANDTLAPGALDEGAEENNLYDTVAGQPRLVNVLPDGSSEPNATFGSPPGVRGAEGEWEPPDFSHVISNDGSRVFWTDLNTHDLYVRENDALPQSPLDGAGRCTVPDDACTVQIDASQGPGESGGGFFWSASSNGAKVFFTDCSRLTADSTAVSGGGCGQTASTSEGLRGNDLYEYDLDSGRLADLTVDPNAADALGADVQGVVGTSEDGEYVYFVADGVLAPGATSGDCYEGEANSTVGCDLYVRHGGVTTFIARLAANDKGVSCCGFESEGVWQPDMGDRVAEVTPDGQHLVFASQRSLTGYDNVSPQSSRAITEVYRYSVPDSELICVSCQPSGAPPAQPYIAAFLPRSHSTTFMQRWISDDGTRVFFDSAEALVPQDTDEDLDVYEWEQDGAGSCERATGCIYLLSGGTSDDNSFLLDASASGDDVFVITRAQLALQDQNDTFDVYDARVGAAAPLTERSCSGAGCQGVPPAPPIFATPASVTFAGVGNFPPPAASVKAKTKKAKPLTHAQKLAKALKACKAKPAGKHNACAEQSRKRYGDKRKAAPRKRKHDTGRSK